MGIWEVTALVLGAIVLACALVAWAGLRIKRNLVRSSPEHITLQPVTLVGVIWQGFFVLYLLAGVSIYHLAPDTTIGSYLQTWQGWAIGFVIGFIAFSLAAGVLALVGYPLSKRTGKVASNTTPHTDARDVPASASSSGARAGGRER